MHIRACDRLLHGVPRLPVSYNFYLRFPRPTWNCTLSQLRFWDESALKKVCVSDIPGHRPLLDGESRGGFEQGDWVYDEMLLCQISAEREKGIFLPISKTPTCANFWLFCSVGEMERKRSFWPGVPNSGTEGDVVFWTPVQHQRYCGVAEDG